MITPEDADGMFDLLTYQKGGSVLRMLERWLGADAFRAGVRHYLDRYQLANTETTDLWDSLESATEPAGAPDHGLVDLPARLPARDGARRRRRVTITQQRFTLRARPTATQRWAIPVRARVHTGATSRDAVAAARRRRDRRSTFPPTRSSCSTPAAKASTASRTRPSGATACSTPGVLEPLERFSLVDDLWASVLAGRRRAAAEFLACARRFADETDLVVWRVLDRAPARRRPARRGRRARPACAPRSRRSSGPTLQRLGWDRAADDDRTPPTARPARSTRSARSPRTRRPIARARGDRTTRGGADADVAGRRRSASSRAHGDADDFDEFVDRGPAPPRHPQEQLRYLYSLGDFPTEELVLRAAELAMSDAVRAQNGPFVSSGALRNREHGPRVWAFVRDHWDASRARFCPSLIPRMIEGITWLVDDASPTTSRSSSARTRWPRAVARSRSTWNGCRCTGRRLHASATALPPRSCNRASARNLSIRGPARCRRDALLVVVGRPRPVGVLDRQHGEAGGTRRCVFTYTK